MNISTVFTALNIKNGTVQNLSNLKTCEVLVTNTTPVNDTGVLLFPNEKLPFSISTGYKIYIRSTSGTCDISVSEINDDYVSAFTDLQIAKIDNADTLLAKYDNTVSCIRENLDPRIVLALKPQDGVWGKYVNGLWVGLDISNAIAFDSDYIQGDNLCIAVNPGDSGYTWFGKGATNILEEAALIDIADWDLSVDGVLNTTKDLGLYKNIKGTSGSDKIVKSATVLATASSKDYCTTIRIRNNGLENIYLSDNFGGEYIIAPGENELAKMSCYGSSSAGLTLYIKTDTANSTFNIDVWKKKMVEQSKYHTPICDYSRPCGQAIISQDWNTSTHSLVMTGLKSSAGRRVDFAQYNTVDGKGNSVEFDVDESHAHMNYSIIANDTIAYAIFENGDEISCEINNAGVSYGTIDLAYDNDDDETIASAYQREGCYIYEGNLSEDELRYELTKIQAGRVYIAATATTEMLPNTPQIADEYGILKDSMKISSAETDIPLIKDAIYEFKTFFGKVFSDYILPDLSMEGDSMIEIIENRVRVKAEHLLDGPIRLKILK
jgi:hypothetical protein